MKYRLFSLTCSILICLFSLMAVSAQDQDLNQSLERGLQAYADEDYDQAKAYLESALVKGSESVCSLSPLSMREADYMVNSRR